MVFAMFGDAPACVRKGMCSNLSLPTGKLLQSFAASSCSKDSNCLNHVRVWFGLVRSRSLVKIKQISAVTVTHHHSNTDFNDWLCWNDDNAWSHHVQTFKHSWDFSYLRICALIYFTDYSIYLHLPLSHCLQDTVHSTSQNGSLLQTVHWQPYCKRYAGECYQSIAWTSRGSSIVGGYWFFWSALKREESIGSKLTAKADSKNWKDTGWWGLSGHL